MKKLKLLLLTLLLALVSCGDDTYNTVTTDPRLKSEPTVENYRDGLMKTYVFVAPYEVKFQKYYKVVKSDDGTVQRYHIATDDEHLFLIEYALRGEPPFNVLCARGTSANMVGLTDNDVIAIKENEVTVQFSSVKYWVKIKLEKQEVSVK